MWWWQAILLYLATWNNFLLHFTFHVMEMPASCLPWIMRLYLYVGQKKPQTPHAFLTSISSSSIHCVSSSVPFHCNPRLNEEYLHLWNASRWRSMKTMCASFATWSTAIRVRMGKGLGAGWRGSLCTDCQCLAESWFPQARGQAELLQEWCWSS